MENEQRSGKSLNRRMRMTRTALIVGCLCMLLAFASCAKEGTGDAAKVTELETKVAALQKSVNDLQLKGQIVGSVLARNNSDKFFHSADFYNVYDSGQADCARRCIANVTAVREACAKKTVEAERLKCFQDASDSAAACQRGCAGL